MSPTASVYPPAVVAEFERLAHECYPCYQCGTCTSSCPSGRELYRGPRRLVRLILAGDLEAVLKSDDLWRCTGCGNCTEVCRMEIDVAGILRQLRAIEREYGGAIRCPERSAAEIATARLQRRPRLDTLRFGATMAVRGHLPKDVPDAATTGLRLARQLLPGRRSKDAGIGAADRAAANGPAGEAPPDLRDAPVSLSFYAGCALPQDRELHALVHEVAAGFGVRLDEADAGCCGHPSRGAVGSRFHSDETVQTACPACDATLVKAGVPCVPLWDTLTTQAKRRGLRLQGAAPAFVPYVGCLAARDTALAGLSAAAELAGVRAVTSYPSLHSGCCGALGGTYRGATKASAMLLDFAAGEQAPIVSTCSLCCDNLRSAARELKRPVDVHFWPEFFRAVRPAGAAAPPVPEESPHA